MRAMNRNSGCLTTKTQRHKEIRQPGSRPGCRISLCLCVFVVKQPYRRLSPNFFAEFSLALGTQTFRDLDLGSPRIRDLYDPETGGVGAVADCAVRLDARRLQFGDECVDVLHFET